MKQEKIMNEINTKDMSFEDVYQSIMPMIHCIAAQIDGAYGLEAEDVVQELSIQAYYAWGKWEPGRGTKFSTYVFDVLVNKKNHLIRIARAKKRNGGTSPSSLDATTENPNNPGKRYSLYDVLTDIEQNTEEQVQMVELWDVVERVLDSMQEKGRGVVRALLSGYTQMEIARLTGATQPLISYYLKSFRTKVKAELEKEGLV